MTKSFLLRVIAVFVALGLIWIYISSTAFHVGAQTVMAHDIRTISRIEPLAFGVTYIDDPTHYQGYTELVSEGAAGEREFKAQLLYKSGRADRVLSIKTTQTGDPINRVVRRGTKVLTSETVSGEKSTKSFTWPLKTYFVSCGFNGYPGHTGVDLAAPYGAPVYAAAGGRVKIAQWYGDYGRCVIIEHADGSSTLYAHNSRLLVRPGQSVKQGQQISVVGSTGNSTGSHLHFEIRDGHKLLDPLIYIDR